MSYISNQEIALSKHEVWLIGKPYSSKNISYFSINKKSPVKL